MLQGQVQDVAVVQVARGRNHQLIRGVVLTEKTRHPVPVQAADRPSRSQDRSAQRLVPPEVLGEDLANQIVRIVFLHLDLFQNHAAFPLHLIGIEPRVEDQIRKNVECQGKMVIQDLGAVTGGFLSREGIQVAADRVHLLGDRFGGAPPGALEQQVLHEMGHAVQFRGFAARAGLDPDPQGNGTDMRHALGENREPIVQHVLIDILHGVRVPRVRTGLLRKTRLWRRQWENGSSRAGDRLRYEANTTPAGFQRGEFTPPRTGDVGPPGPGRPWRSGLRPGRSRFPAVRVLCRSIPGESPWRPPLPE